MDTMCTSRDMYVRLLVRKKIKLDTSEGAPSPKSTRFFSSSPDNSTLALSLPPSTSSSPPSLSRQPLRPSSSPLSYSLSGVLLASSHSICSTAGCACYMIDVKQLGSSCGTYCCLHGITISLRNSCRSKERIFKTIWSEGKTK